MEAKSRFKVKLSNEAQEFLDGLPNKVREKIISNIRKSTFVLDPDLFKKLDDTSKIIVRYNFRFNLIFIAFRTYSIVCFCGFTS